MDDEELFKNICEKVRCTLLSADMEKLNYVREMQARLQHQSIFTNVLGTDKYVDEMDLDWIERVRSYSTEKSISDSLDGSESAELEHIMEEEEVTAAKSEATEEQASDVWQGYFKGFQILSEAQEGAIGDKKKCIELTCSDCDDTIINYLHAGISCFAVDLFYGTVVENQALILRVRESELKLSKEIGFPISSTIFAKLSPRLQYTGLMDPPDAEVVLNKGDELTLTSMREYSTHCSKSCVYVNAAFLFNDVNVFDYICIGSDIQVAVRRKDTHLRCTVEVGGKLSSRMPVLFPSRCTKFLVSMEELEDITFCKEVGINIIVSYIGGTEEYFENLQYALKTLGCDKMRIYARIVLNEVKGCDHDMDWMAENYDGFIIELSPSDKHPEKDILHLCPAGEAFIKRAYQLQKVIVLAPTLIVNKRLIVDPAHYHHIFHYPDKYILPCVQSNSAFYFFYLQDSISELLIEEALSKQPYCDRSLTGSDTLARSVACASYEMHAPVIFVCSLTGRMAAKISHFRPRALIIFITRMKSAETFISMHHNVRFLYYNGITVENYYCSLYKHLLFGLLYAESQRLIKHNDNVMFVYRETASIRLPNKYVTYKYHARHFPQHLDKILFSKFPDGFFKNQTAQDVKDSNEVDSVSSTSSDILIKKV
uniref:Pyruvate kinase n=1 Tax=Bactrocera latifrons TaxID=174628 RepID=A0A0K8U184_BACLA